MPSVPALSSAQGLNSGKSCEMKELRVDVIPGSMGNFLHTLHSCDAGLKQRASVFPP